MLTTTQRRLTALALYTISSALLACSAFRGAAEDPGAGRPSGTLGDGGAVNRPIRPPSTGGVGGGFVTGGAGGTGFCGIDFPCSVPPPTGGMCFECQRGCFDCGMGCFCDNPPAPVPAAWTPPFKNVGDDGWLDGEDPLCVGLPELNAADLWAGPEGVHVAASGYGPEAFAIDDVDGGVALGDFEALGFPKAGLRDAGVNQFEFLPRTRLLRNSGHGWVRRAELPGSAFDVMLRGLGDGTLALASMPGGDSVSCPLGMIREDSLECLAVDPISDLFYVSDTLSYGLMLGTRLLTWDGAKWRGASELLPYPALVLWANADTVLAFGTAGTILRSSGSAWELVNVDSFESFTAVWGNAPDDLWLGTATGKVLHFDGSSVEERYAITGTTCDPKHPVIGLYGAGDALFIQSRSQLARVEDGGELEVLGDWSCQFNGSSQEMVALSGTGPEDVYVLVRDLSIGSDCGALFVAHYDGEEFHRM